MTTAQEMRIKAEQYNTNEKAKVFEEHQNYVEKTILEMIREEAEQGNFRVTISIARGYDVNLIAKILKEDGGFSLIESLPQAHILTICW